MFRHIKTNSFALSLSKLSSPFLAVAICLTPHHALADIFTFETPSQNIQCSVGQEPGHTDIECTIIERSGPPALPRPANCKSDWGHTFTMTERGSVEIACKPLDRTQYGQQVAKYGVRGRFGGISCRSSKKGLECYNRDRNGFLLGRKQQIIFDTSKLNRKTLLDIETNLRILGYKPGAVDGISDRSTKRAIQAFQKRYRLPLIEPMPQHHIVKLRNLARIATQKRKRAQRQEQQRQQRAKATAAKSTQSQQAVNNNSAHIKNLGKFDPVYYEPGHFNCWQTRLLDRGTCQRMLQDLAVRLGCPRLKGHPSNLQPKNVACIKKKTGDASHAGFQKLLADYYTKYNDESVKPKPVRLADRKPGNYKQGNFRCTSSLLLSQADCNWLKLDLAMHLKCLPKDATIKNNRDHKAFLTVANRCTKRRSGISSSQSRNNMIAYERVIQDFYDAAQSSKNGELAASGELKKLPLNLDGYGHAVGYSNIYNAQSTCPDVPKIEIRLTATKQGGRPWNAKEIYRIVANPYEVIRVKGNGANQCLKKPIEISVKLDDQQIAKQTYNHYRENKRAFMDRLGQSVIAKILNNDPNQPSRDIFALMRNSKLMRAINNGDLNYHAMSARDQVSIKQLFLIYHNKFYPKCILPGKNSTNPELRNKALEAGLFGQVETVVTRYRPSSGQVLDENRYKNLDVKPAYVSQYVDLSNSMRRGSMNTFLLQGYDTLAIQSALSRDLDILLEKNKCFDKNLNQFERSLSHYARKKLNPITSDDITSGFIKK